MADEVKAAAAMAKRSGTVTYTLLGTKARPVPSANFVYRYSRISSSFVAFD